MPEERIYSVTGPDLECSAKDCVPNDSDKFFFTFPSCEPSETENVERCRTWVKNAGNLDLLKCISSELAGKFYLCCHHFADWTAICGTRRYIAANATPTIFNNPPLASRFMKCFPMTSESLKNSNTPESMDIEPPKEDKSESVADRSAESSPTVNCIDAIKTETDDFEADNGCTRDSEGPPSEDITPLVESVDPKLVQKGPEVLVKRTISKKRKSPVEQPSSRPSRKAKQDAANRISKQFIPVKDSEQSGSEGPEESEDNAQTSEQSPNNTANTNSLRKRICLTPNSPEGLSAKRGIFSKDVVAKLNTALSNKSPPSISNDRENKGAKITVLPEPGSKLRQENIHILISPPPSQAQASFVKEPLGLRPILPKPSSVQVISEKPCISSFNVIPFPRVEKKAPPAAPVFDSVMHITRTTSTQTDLHETDGLFLKILECDSKLSVFTGLPSHEVLDKITDATLRMVISNKATINDIESTMRMWIMLTCTKFMLGISSEALSVMYEVSEEECQKIIEKTSLFLRKTLSLPDCQKYVWTLPNNVLNGIADYSDSMLC